MDATMLSRLQFGFTITYHYLFPQLTMGLALLIFVLKTRYMRSGDEAHNQAARFWAKIFALSFVMGVVTGIPMEFQFGTNWARFSAFAGGVIAHTLAMEGAYAFFLESVFLGVFLFGEKRFGQRVHWFSALMIFLGTWLSAYFILATMAWMQHPVGYHLTPAGVDIARYRDFLLNPWLVASLPHNQSGSVVTAAFVMAGVGAYYLLSGQHERFGRMFVKLGVIVGLLASLFQLYPSGDWQGRQVAEKQPIKLAAMEGLFKTERGAGIAILGQPDMERRRLDNPLIVPWALSFLTYQNWKAEIKGLDAFPEEDWPDNIPLLYYCYHIMVGLGTIFIAIMGVAAFLLWRRQLFASRPMLWVLMLAMPFPFIANSAGWMVTELGRQPWLVYGLMRTSEGSSPQVSSGNVWFTLLGFMGMYLLLGVLYLFLTAREIAHGPEAPPLSPGEAQGMSA
jgi:cytochrome d ubiquinol oxidase subunit I